MTIASFTPANLRPLREEMEAALKAVSDKHGIKFTLGTMTYDYTGTTFSAKVTAETAGSEERDRKQALDYAKSYGIDATEPSTHPRASGAVLVEFRAAARARPWVYSLGGKQYVTDLKGIGLMWPKVAEVSPI